MTVWLEMATALASRASSGSWNTLHQSPLGSLARGVAIFQPAISLYCGETIAAGSSKLGPTGAQPASEAAVASAANGILVRDAISFPQAAPDERADNIGSTAALATYQTSLGK